MNAHVVQRRGDCSRSYRAGVARGDCDKDGVDVRMAHEQGRQHPSRPGRCARRYELKGDEKWQRPDLGEETDEKAFVQALRQPSVEE